LFHRNQAFLVVPALSAAPAPCPSQSAMSTLEDIADSWTMHSHEVSVSENADGGNADTMRATRGPAAGDCEVPPVSEAVGEEVPEVPSEAEQRVEAQFKLRYSALKGVYEDRVKSMTGQMRQMYQYVQSDEVLRTLRADPVTANFIQPRMKEIIEDGIESERESYIHRLAQQLSGQQAVETENDLLRSKMAAQAQDYQILLKRVELLHNSTHHGKLISQLQKENERLAASLSKQNHLSTTLGTELERTKDDSSTLAGCQKQLEERKRKCAEWKKDCRRAVAEQQNATQMLERSEAERLELRGKYIELGEKMEQALQGEAVATNKAMQALQEKVKTLRSRLADEAKKNQGLQASKGQEAKGLEKDLELEIRRAKVSASDYENRLEQRERELSAQRTQYESRLKALHDDMEAQVEQAAKEKEQERKEKMEEAHRQKYQLMQKQMEQEYQTMIERYQSEILGSSSHGIQLGIPRQQHDRELAELATKHQLDLRELEEKKGSEFCMAMLNVRQGIKTLETQLEEEKQERHKLEATGEEDKNHQLELRKQIQGSDVQKRALAQALNEANGNIAKLKEILMKETNENQETKARIQFQQASRQSARPSQAQILRNVHSQLLPLRESLSWLKRNTQADLRTMEAEIRNSFAVSCIHSFSAVV
jgi:hypothetical protein